MSQALISWPRLSRENPFDISLRLATIWFDNVVFHMPGEDMLTKVVDQLVGKGEVTATTADELLKHWTPIHSVMPEYAFLARGWESGDDVLRDIVLKTASETVKREYPDIHEGDAGFLHEVA